MTCRSSLSHKGIYEQSSLLRLCQEREREGEGGKNKHLVLSDSSLMRPSSTIQERRETETSNLPNTNEALRDVRVPCVCVLQGPNKRVEKPETTKVKKKSLKLREIKYPGQGEALTGLGCSAGESLSKGCWRRGVSRGGRRTYRKPWW